MKRCFKSLFAFILVFGLFFSLSSIDIEAAEKKTYNTWQDVAKDMNIEFQAAKKFIEEGNNDEAYNAMNRAYFGYYEVQGFEKNVMVNIAAKRVNEIEATFRRIKHTLKGNIQGNVAELDKEIDTLAMKVYKDAMVLDGVASKDDPDELGNKVFSNEAVSVYRNGIWSYLFFHLSLLNRYFIRWSWTRINGRNHNVPCSCSSILGK